MSRQHTSSNYKARARGFTLIEVMVAIAVLTVGLLGMAFMMASTMVFGTESRYMNMANVLASEKLDGLNKYPTKDPNIDCAGTCGSLTGPAACAAGDIYCDTVTVSESSGADYETQTQVNTDGITQTTTIVHTSSGCIDTPTNCGVAGPPATGSTFTRRWLITVSPTITSTGGAGATVTGYKRITVNVVQNNSTPGKPISFQMSMVRP